MIAKIDYAMPNEMADMQMALAMAYVPYQEWGDIYEVDMALARGTLFPELDKPFIGEEAVPYDRT